MKWSALPNSHSAKTTARKSKRGGEEYLTDLNNDIEPGWTGSGQTQFLLGKIANRERVFHHALFGGSPLESQALADRIVEVAQALPGYAEFCGHQHEIGKKAKEWARSAEQRYYPYGSDQNLLESLEKPPEDRKPTWNEQQSQEARDRIKHAIGDLLENRALPAQATARRRALRGYGIGNVTLDKYRSLWHPKNLESSLEKEYHPVEVDGDNSESLESLPDVQFHPKPTNKLYHLSASAPSVQKADGITISSAGGCGGVSTGELAEANSHLDSASEDHQATDSEDSLSGPAFVWQILNQLATKRQQSKRDRMPESSIPDEHYFAKRNEQLELLDMSSLLISPADSCSSPDDLLNASVVPEHESNLNVEKFLTVSTSEVEDVGDLIAEIQVQVQRLAWSPIQAKAWVAEYFGGRSRWQLIDDELVLLLHQLQSAHRTSFDGETS